MLCGVKPSRLHQTILIGIIHLPAVYIQDNELNTPFFGCLLLRISIISKEPPVVSVDQDCCI